MSSANLTLQNLPHRIDKRVQIQAPWGPFIFANECWNVSLNPTLSHFGAMWWSGVLLNMKSPRCTMKVFTCIGKQFSFQNVRNVMLAVQFHSRGYKSEWRSPSGCDCCPHHHRKWILASAYSPAFHWSISTPNLSFRWFRHCWTSNFFSSSVSTKMGIIPSFMRFRMCWHLSSLIRSRVVERACLFCIL